MSAKLARTLHTHIMHGKDPQRKGVFRKGMKEKGNEIERGRIEERERMHMAIKPLNCIVSVTNTLHHISSLVIEIIVYLYIHYLLSCRAKGQRNPSFCKKYQRGKTPKS